MKKTGPDLSHSFKSAFSPEFLQKYQDGVLAYSYRDIPCLKSPIDMAIYLRLIWDLRPKTVIEVGTKAGGSAVLLADIMAIFDLKGNIFSLDIAPPKAIEDPRIRFLKGDVCDLDRDLSRHGIISEPHPWLVIEDSAHTYEGCLAALNSFAKAMSKGDILVMEDGILDELNLSSAYQGGPNRAIREFLRDRPNQFEIMREYCDMFGKNATYNPNGYLRKL